MALKGEVKVYTYSNPERYEEIKEIYVENKPYKIEKVRFQGNTVILKLSGIDDRNAAESCKGKEIYIAESELPALPEDTYYILQNTAQDVYEVRRESGKDILIPGVAEFILDIEVKERKITVKLPDGLLDL